MSNISKQTATAIALAHQEIERGYKLLADIEKCIEQRKDRWNEGEEDLRDSFGYRHRSMTLGIPSGSNGHQLVDVSYELAIPVIKAHIANKEALVSSLSLQAVAEANAEVKP